MFTFRYFCDQCTKSFSKNTSLLNHIKYVHEGKGIQCDLCDFRTLFSRDMENHMEIKHPDTVEGNRIFLFLVILCILKYRL